MTMSPSGHHLGIYKSLLWPIEKRMILPTNPPTSCRTPSHKDATSFTSDWQLLLKWHSAHSFLPKSKVNATLTPIQGRGCKGCSAIDQVTQQVVENKLIHLNQCSALDLFLDLCHCFDYMVEACHNMACHHHGVVDDYLWLHVQTITSCDTMYDTSTESLMTTAWLLQTHGMVQARGQARGQWMLLFATLFDRKC